MIFAVRDEESAPRIEGIEELRLGGLDPKAAVTLLGGVLPTWTPECRPRWPRPPEATHWRCSSFRDCWIGAAHGAEPVAQTDPWGVCGRTSFAERIGRLTWKTRLALVAAAASEADDLGMLGAVLSALDLDVGVLAPAEDAGLLSVGGGGFAFRHPLARSAAYESAAADERRRVHRAQAAALEGTRPPTPGFGTWRSEPKAPMRLSRPSSSRAEPVRPRRARRLALLDSSMRPG